MIWPVLEQSPMGMEETREPRRGLLSTLRKIFGLSTIGSSLVTSPSKRNQVLLSTSHAWEAERNFIKEVEELGANATLSYQEKEAYGKSILQVSSHVHMDFKGAETRSHVVPAGKGQESQVAFARFSKDTCDSETAIGHDSTISALHGKVLAEVLANPTEWEVTLDVDTLLSDGRKPTHRRSGSVRFLQTDSVKLQVAKWRAFAMFTLNKSDEGCSEGCLYACRVNGCGSVCPTFRSLIYHLHLHDVNQGMKCCVPIRAYCEACDTTFETRRDLIVHRCPLIANLSEEHTLEKTADIFGKGLSDRLSQLAKRLNPITSQSHSA